MVTEKHCYHCNKILPATKEFFCKDSSRADGLNHSCKVCSNERRKSYLAKDPRRRKKYALRYNFGMTLEEFDALLEKQDGKCAICRRDPGSRSLHVDHNHETGAIRSLLCHGCNTALGLLMEDPEIGRALVAYMEDQ